MAASFELLGSARLVILLEFILIVFPEAIVTSPLRLTAPVPVVNGPAPCIRISLPDAIVTSPLRLTAPVPVVNVELPCIVIFPVKVADKSEARVKIVSSIAFKVLPLPPGLIAVIKIIAPP